MSVALNFLGKILTDSRMLYDFHSQQNAKKPGAVHATYLVSGTKRKETPVVTNGGAKKDGEDDYMQSSPFMSSSMPQSEEDTGETSGLTISLVREEELDGNAFFPQTNSRYANTFLRSTLPIREDQCDTYLQSRTPSIEGTVFPPIPEL